MIGRDRKLPVIAKQRLRVGKRVPRHLYLVDPAEENTARGEEEIGLALALEDGPILMEAFNAAQWGPEDPPPPAQVYALRDAGVAEGNRYLARVDDGDLWIWGVHSGYRMGRLHVSGEPQSWEEAVKEAIVLVPVDWSFSMLAEKRTSHGFLDSVDWRDS